MVHRRYVSRALVAAVFIVVIVHESLGHRVSALPGSNVEAAPFELVPSIVFTSTRDNPAGVGSGTPQEKVFNAAELYVMLMADDGSRASDPLRLTDDQSGDGFASISPSGKQLVFDSNRSRTAGEPYQISDLFMTSFGQYLPGHSQIPADQLLHLTRGSSASWSPDGKRVAFHASQSGIYTTDTLARPDPGTPTLDSDIFVLNVDDCLVYQDQCAAKLDLSGALPEFMANLTKDTGAPTLVDEDPDWSPDGATIAFTRHDGEAGTFFTQNHNNANAEIYLLQSGGSGGLERVTDNLEEERAPAWSPDGARILYMCRRSDPPGQLTPFQLCIIERDGQGGWVETQLTNDGKAHLTPQWSPDGRFIVFQRAVSGQLQLFRLDFVMTTGGAGVMNETQLTGPPLDGGLNAFAGWDLIRVHTK